MNSIGMNLAAKVVGQLGILLVDVMMNGFREDYECEGSAPKYLFF